MATIGDTLRELRSVQDVIEQENDRFPNNFLSELLSVTTVIYFGYLSHSVLDKSRNLNLGEIEGSEDYYRLYASENLLEEFIRVNNIGHFLVIWTIYERYLREKALKDFGIKEFKIHRLFNEFTAHLKIKGLAKITQEFDVMRHTRNSLHDGGIFSPDFTVFSGKLCDQVYTFIPGIEVKPLRIMDVIDTVWQHYNIFEGITIQK